LCAKP